MNLIELLSLDVNFHLTRETHTQYSVKIKVWASMIDSQVIEPIFLDDNLRECITQKYFKHILQFLVIKQNSPL